MKVAQIAARRRMKTMHSGQLPGCKWASFQEAPLGTSFARNQLARSGVQLVSLVVGARSLVARARAPDDAKGAMGGQFGGGSGRLCGQRASVKCKKCKKCKRRKKCKKWVTRNSSQPIRRARWAIRDSAPVWREAELGSRLARRPISRAYLRVKRFTWRPLWRFQLEFSGEKLRLQ